MAVRCRVIGHKWRIVRVEPHMESTWRDIRYGVVVDMCIWTEHLECMRCHTGQTRRVRSSL